jgi:hypothetical protein
MVPLNLSSASVGSIKLLVDERLGVFPVEKRGRQLAILLQFLHSFSQAKRPHIGPDLLDVS